MFKLLWQDAGFNSACFAKLSKKELGQLIFYIGGSYDATKCNKSQLIELLDAQLSVLTSSSASSFDREDREADDFQTSGGDGAGRALLQQVAQMGQIPQHDNDNNDGEYDNEEDDGSDDESYGTDIGINYKESTEMKIFIILTGDVKSGFNINVHPEYTIALVKKIIKKYGACPIDMQLLFFQGELLDDTTTLAYNNIGNESELQLRYLDYEGAIVDVYFNMEQYIRFRGSGDGEFPVFVKCADWGTHAIRFMVNSTDTATYLKALIKDAKGIKIMHQRLSFNGSVLTTEGAFSGISAEAMLLLTIRGDGGGIFAACSVFVLIHFMLFLCVL